MKYNGLKYVSTDPQKPCILFAIIMESIFKNISFALKYIRLDNIQISRRILKMTVHHFPLVTNTKLAIVTAGANLGMQKAKKDKV